MWWPTATRAIAKAEGTVDAEVQRDESHRRLHVNYELDLL